MVDADVRLEALAQRAVCVAQDGELVGSAELAGEAEVGFDRALGSPPLLVKGRQRPACPLLEQAVGGREPCPPVAAAALDRVPRPRPVERLEHGRAREAVSLIELARHLPAHVPENTAEVEDDAAQLSTCLSLRDPEP